MNVLNLATEEKQDQILSNFPISGGTDFHSGVPLFIDSSSIVSGTKLANISGKGIVTSITVSGGHSGDNGFTMKADGRTLISNRKVNSSAFIATGVLLPFSTSFEIIVYPINDNRYPINLLMNYVLL